MQIVIIGGVAAGLKAASKARRLNRHAEITVIEKGELISYGACGLPYYVAGDVNELEDLMKTPAGALRNSGFFKNVKGINVLTRTLAIKIDRNAKIVVVKNVDSGVETGLAYDKLVIATGASPIVPDIPGIGLRNIFQFWHPDDAKAIRVGLETGRFRNAVIIGAGLIGMEMAEAFMQWQLPVTMVEMKEQVFPAFLDVDIAGIVEKYCREKGIHLQLNEHVVRFEGDGEVAGVVTNKQTLTADLVVLAIGVRPNVELAKLAGLAVGTTGGIEVNEYLRTSDSDIYAGGDCVENVNMITGKKMFTPMGSIANKHGRVIGENICGGKVKFRGVLGTSVVKVLDLNVGKTGLTEREVKDLGYEYITVVTSGHDKPHYMPDANFITIKLIVDTKTRKVLGVQAVGEGEVAKRIDVVSAVLTLNGTVDDLFDIDLSYAPPYNSPIDNVAVAANLIMNKLAGRLKGISTLAAKEKLNTDGVVLLDVRTPAECKQIRLGNCTNIKYIPLGELRKRCGELNKDDEIVAFCKISLRGYEAEGILEGEDFKKVRVLEGGIVAWPFECEK